MAPDGDWLITFALLADAVAELQDAEQASVLYDRLMPYREANVVIGYGAVCFGPVERYLGRLATVMGRRSGGDRASARRDRDREQALRAPVYVAHARLDLAAALSLGGDGSEPRTLIEQAAATAAELDLPLVARRAESLASPLGG